MGSLSADSPSICTAGGWAAVVVQFDSELGDLPLLSAGTASLGGTISVTETTQGTKENVECSNNGYCDETSGLCSCFSGYASSDGDGNKGARGDCVMSSCSCKLRSWQVGEL